MAEYDQRCTYIHSINYEEAENAIKKTENGHDREKEMKCRNIHMPFGM